MERNEKKLKVAVLGLRGIPDVQGGIEKHCEELYPRLIKYNFDITLFARKGYVNNNNYEYKGVKVIPLWAPRRKNIETICHTALGILWLSRYRKDFDFLHIHAIGPSLFAKVARKLGFCLVITNHGPEYKRKKWGWMAKSILKIGERLGARHAHKIIAVSKNIKKNLFEQYNLVAEYIPNGVNIKKSERSVSNLSKFNLKPKRYFLAVGRIVPEKGFHDLLKAFKRLDTDWKLVIVGSADHKDRYSDKLIRESSKINGAVMTGFQKGEALNELYSNAGLFILPSYHEGLPIVALEAMSYNLAMLTSNLPANAEVALPEEMFPVGNVEILSKMMNKHIKNPSSLTSPQILTKKMERLTKEFNWDIIAKQTAKLYREAVAMYKKEESYIN